MPGTGWADADAWPNHLSYAGNLLNLLVLMTEPKLEPHAALERALDVLFILHADHEQNCSINAMRSVGSSGVDPYSTVAAAAAAALYGPLHGGANEAVLRMLRTIFIRQDKAGEAKLMGFGHRVYKNYAPRARIIKRIADEVFEATRPSPLLPIALELERIALQDAHGGLAGAAAGDGGDPEQKIARPRQIYTGASRRGWVPPGRRT
jgi:citrate synthase